MKGHEAAAARLQRLYAEELQQLLRPEVLASMDETPSVHERQARARIRHARERSPIVCEVPDETIWIWSDLHSGDMGTIRAFDRRKHTTRPRFRQRRLDSLRHTATALGYTLIPATEVTEQVVVSGQESAP